MVKDQSIIINSEQIIFIITDFKNEINISYSGSVPNLFCSFTKLIFTNVYKAAKLINVN